MIRFIPVVNITGNYVDVLILILTLIMIITVCYFKMKKHYGSLVCVISEIKFCH